MWKLDFFCNFITLFMFGYFHIGYLSNEMVIITCFV